MSVVALHRFQESSDLRTVIVEGEPWFVAADANCPCERHAAAAAAASYAASVAAARAEDSSLRLLVGLLDEYERLTARPEPAPLTDADTQRLAVLTGAVA